MSAEIKFLQDLHPPPPPVDDHITDLLPLYYKRLFPYNSLIKWLGAGDLEKFSRREISFTLVSDIYLRYQSFDTCEEFMQELSKKCPIKIDVGATYTTKPKHKSPVGIMTPVEKEIVFDIDMTDYDEIRTCCSGAGVCSKCWKFMVIACKILDAALREDFGFKHLLWVFSGRRGVHCWVSDHSACVMSDSERSTVGEFLQLLHGGANLHRKVSLMGDHVHSSAERALKIIDKYFLTLVEEQDFLGTEARIESFLNIIDESIRYHFKEVMTPGLSSRDLWNIFEKTVHNLNKKGQLPKNSRHMIEEIKIQYSYPRLDINVTRGFNHLLKLPFCVHPKTGKVCVPFSPKFVEHFDLAAVPTISLLINEINNYDQKTQDQQKKIDTGDNNVNVAKIKDYKKTSLLKAVSLFHEFLRGLEKTWKTSGANNNSMEF